jgi:hypothetical protein
MKLYVCVNDGMDGDMHIAVFTTEQRATEFCRANEAFNDGPDWLYYRTVEMTDNVAVECSKYFNRRME